MPAYNVVPHFAWSCRTGRVRPENENAMKLTLVLAFLVITGCASVKQSDTARTGIEQLLISSAVDEALDKVDFQPIAGARVHLKTDYLDCVDKNYVIVGLHSRLLARGCTIADTAADADVLLEVASGGVGTDRTDLTVGTPEIPLGLMGSIPKLTVFERKRAMGTAKLKVVGTDVASREVVLDQGYSLARSDHQFWSAMGAGPVMSGSVATQLTQHTGSSESMLPATWRGGDKVPAKLSSHRRVPRAD